MNKRRPGLDDGPTNQRLNKGEELFFISFLFMRTGISASAHDEMRN